MLVQKAHATLASIYWSFTSKFYLQANRDVTRMEIFMSLVQLLEQTVKGNASSVNAMKNSMMVQHSFPLASPITATGRPSSLQ